MSTSSKAAELFTLLRERDHFLITSHARPDGDAIGSSLGLMHLLDGLGKHVDVAFADPLPAVFHSLPGAERIHIATLPPAPPQAAILLECDSIERTGFTAVPAPLTINIDHHHSGRNFGNWNWINPEACAVGAMVYDFALACGLPITPAAATCLYAAVLTDTGCFTFACTSSAVFDLASHLLQCGADAGKIAENIYFNNPEAKVRVLGASLSRMVVEGPLAWSVITLADMQQFDAVAADCEGVVNYLIGIAGVQAAAVFREMPPTQSGPAFRCSLRSKGKTDVARVAEGFGGGGHLHASGCTLGGEQDVAIAAVLAGLRAMLLSGTAA